MQQPPALQGRKVLLVEDESILSMLAEDVLADAGCTVMLAMRLPEAVELARSGCFHLAVLDVNLGGGDTSYPIAEILLERRIPFMFATGYDSAGLDARFRDCPRVQKPYAPEQLLQTAAVLAEHR